MHVCTCFADDVGLVSGLFMLIEYFLSNNAYIYTYISMYMNGGLLMQIDTSEIPYRGCGLIKNCGHVRDMVDF